MKNRAFRAFVVVAVACGVTLTCGARFALAEEGGSGHYIPGSMASFIDGVPLKPAFVVRYETNYYTGSVGADVALPIGGKTALGVDASVWVNELTFSWRPPVEFGTRWSYAMSATIPFLSVTMSADAFAAAPVGGTTSGGRKDSFDAFGDIVVQPLMLNYNIDPDLNVNFRVSVYAPTGNYEVGRLANPGKNFWTIEPTLAFIYLGAKNGRELSVFAGLDFNTENVDTNYTSGTQFHLDGTAAQHRSIFGGLGGLGITGYYYQQIVGDSGAGATLGEFKASAAGVGPVVSFVKNFGHPVVMVEVKWLHEFETKNRLEGDRVFLEVAFEF